jgi:hypothetical protein
LSVGAATRPVGDGWEGGAAAAERGPSGVSDAAALGLRGGVVGRDEDPEAPWTAARLFFWRQFFRGVLSRCSHGPDDAAELFSRGVAAGGGLGSSGGADAAAAARRARGLSRFLRVAVAPWLSAAAAATSKGGAPAAAGGGARASGASADDEELARRAVAAANALRRAKGVVLEG